MNNKTVKVLEALEFCVKKEVEGSQARLDSFIKNRKLATNQKVALQKDLECYFKEVKILSGGKNGEVEIGDLKEDVSERKDGRINNGAKETETEYFMKELMFNKLLNEKLPDKALEGLSFSGWANHFNMFDTPKGVKVDNQLIESLNAHYKMQHGGTYRPQEIVDYLHQRFYDIRKAVVAKCFNRLVAEGRITLEENYILVTPEWKWDKGGKRSKLTPTIKVSDKEKYDEVRATEDEVLEKHNVTRNRYNSNINIRKKSKEMQALFDDMAKTVAKKHKVKMIYKAHIPTVVNQKQKLDISYHGINDYFLDYAGETIQKHHTNIGVRISTYFKTRFMYINFYVMLFELGNEDILNVRLYNQEVAHFNMEHIYYMEDVDFSQSHSFFGAQEDRRKVVNEELKLIHTERNKTSKLLPVREMHEGEEEIEMNKAYAAYVDEQLDGLLDFTVVNGELKAPLETKQKEVEIMTPKNELDWMDKFAGRKRKKVEKRKSEAQNGLLKTDAPLINIESIGIESDPSSNLRQGETQIFSVGSSMFGRLPEPVEREVYEYEEIPDEVTQDWTIELMYA